MSQAGGKTFFLDVGVPRTRISLGKYPKTPLKDARKKAIQILWSDEPLSSTRTLSEAFDAYYEGHISRNCRPATARKLKNLISAQLPHLADRAIASITARDLSTVIESYADRPATANRLHAVLSAFFRWSQRNQYITRSPLTFPKPHKNQPRDRVLSERVLAIVPDTDGKGLQPTELLSADEGRYRAVRAGIGPTSFRLNSQLTS